MIIRIYIDHVFQILIAIYRQRVSRGLILFSNKEGENDEDIQILKFYRPKFTHRRSEKIDEEARHITHDSFFFIILVRTRKRAKEETV